MAAQTERTYDEYERLAVSAIMRESAHRAKRPKTGDLFKRPSDEDAEREDVEVMKQESERLNEWLAGLGRKNDDREEETDV